MPVMGGLEFTKEVMANHPKPILLVSISANGSSKNAFEVLEAGAVDLYLKPAANAESGFDKHASEFIQKIKILAGVRVFKRPRTASAAVVPPVIKQQKTNVIFPNITIRMVTIGASTGGPQALQAILSTLPENFPLPILCVQHINEGFLGGLVDWLSSQCRIKIEIATPGLFPLPGTVYFPQERAHLKIDDKGRLAIEPGQPMDGHLPSVTVTMRSVAQYYGKSAMGILLTGMGKDGAEGLLDIRKTGGITLVQDENSCIVFGMPKVAIEIGAAGYVLPLNEIGPSIMTFVER